MQGEIRTNYSADGYSIKKLPISECYRERERIQAVGSKSQCHAMAGIRPEGKENHRPKREIRSVCDGFRKKKRDRGVDGEG